MQIREVPVTPTAENSNELEEEAEWIYRQAFTKPTVSKQVRLRSFDFKEKFLTIVSLVYLNSSSSRSKSYFKLIIKLIVWQKLYILAI